MDHALTKQRVSVETESELVVMKFGNTEVKMHYSDALKLSQWIRVKAKEAKASAGDISEHWSVMAKLSDADGVV